MKPYIVLNPFYCSDMFSFADKSWRIGTDLVAFTKSLGLKPLNDPEHPAQDWTPWNNLHLHAEVKNWTPDAPDGKVWHQDGDTTPGSRMDCRIVLWADKTPTEFCFKVGDKIFQPKPFEVVIFNNKACYHRQPPNAPDRRYIFRQRVESK